MYRWSTLFWNPTFRKMEKTQLPSCWICQRDNGSNTSYYLRRYCQQPSAVTSRERDRLSLSPQHTRLLPPQRRNNDGRRI